jgi:hypothetical protein
VRTLVSDVFTTYNVALFALRRHHKFQTAIRHHADHSALANSAIADIISTKCAPWGLSAVDH